MHVSAYYAFAALAQRGTIPRRDLPAWNASIGLRNRIVHGYMNIDLQQVLEITSTGRYRDVTRFLQAPVGAGNSA